MNTNNNKFVLNHNDLYNWVMAMRRKSIDIHNTRERVQIVIASPSSGQALYLLKVQTREYEAKHHAK